MPLDVAAYYYPGFHADRQTAAWHGAGWTEWELVKAARPRYPGHEQPRIPAWGCFDEADPDWAQRQIELAVSHGITTFIFDWYWYRGRPFLDGALQSGFLAAPNAADMKFAVMWANHDWLDIHPASSAGPPRLLLPGVVSRAEFDALIDHVVGELFSRGNYYRIGGAPYFSIYNVRGFLDAMGSLKAASDALNRLRERARAAGEPDVHINATLFDLPVIPGETPMSARAETVKELHISSVGSYVWVHHYPPGKHGFPRDSYDQAFETNAALWREFRQEFDVPYFPNVTVGWDPSPRTQQDAPFLPRGYPWASTLAGNTPKKFEAALRAARAFLDEQPAPGQLLTVNAWNEWTEGSYLLPDARHGTDYLQATRRVFPELVPVPTNPNLDEEARP